MIAMMTVNCISVAIRAERNAKLVAIKKGEERTGGAHDGLGYKRATGMASACAIRNNRNHRNHTAKPPGFCGSGGAKNFIWQRGQ